MNRAMRVVVALLSLVLTLAPPAARAAEPVDLLLVLAADVSRSVTEPKFKLQREGAAAAIAHPDVVRAMTSGPNRRIAVCFVEWAAAGMQSVIIDWTVIAGEADARNFAGKLVDVPRTVNNPIRLGFAKPRVSGVPSAVGQNSEEILRELGHSDADIAALKMSGVLG